MATTTSPNVEQYLGLIALPRGRRENGLLPDMSDEDSLWRPRVDIPSIAWHVGHMATVEAVITVGLHGGRMDEIPEYWAEHYKIGATLPDPANDLTPLSQLLPEVLRVRGIVEEYLQGVAPEDFDRPFENLPEGFPDAIKNLAIGLSILPIHEGHHNGEITVLTRLLEQKN